MAVAQADPVIGDRDGDTAPQRENTDHHGVRAGVFLHVEQGLANGIGECLDM